ncbi:MFS monocarboxylate [Colletotrichum kahawae]|uniref:MFS monocarboxylate n=1 Tax=Colletotrichum kahawae TaxID=34407 RepID=A0AAE0DBW8_COLKA|nr:MFS monocarboxylate [Colletotrichum kahawae]
MPSETQSLELQGVTQHPEITTDDTSAHSLPPADKGMPALNFLFGSFIVEAVLWGFPLSYGVFQDYYTKHPNFQQDFNIAVIGTVATSVYFLGGPIATPLVARFQAWQ